MSDKSDKTVKVATISFGNLCWVVWIVLLILKLTGPLADLNWFWVWFPFWLPFALCGVCLLFGLICCLIIAGLSDNR